jgi:glucan phosphoethanolaminetransferase (alkaline phosphatase superfamily)
MNLKDIKQKLFPIFKIISIILITSAISLELWNIQTSITNSQLPSFLTPVLILTHVVLSAHFLEALIAAYYAPTRNQISIKYAAYTFFVGIFGLLELFDNDQEKELKGKG